MVKAKKRTTKRAKTTKKSKNPFANIKCKTTPSGHTCKTGGIYCIGFIGAAVYYISTAPGFWMGVWGVIKALVWPAFLVFQLFKFLGL
jgi:hypothetical protein